ncbi:hemolysin XhlA family protein [Mesobacillus zeae]|uniref:hemolysin XhlA family protein n=1 Tax=Mesobacillus zeae TaxID=1917180 RepID=UPI001FE7A1D6|nr:hemolysin XhlA family protein [Mesobacillus zeae]
MEAENVQIDPWKSGVQKDINDMKADIRRLQDKQLLQDQTIQGIKDALTEIKEDTKWLKRTITNALISASIIALVGGAIAIVFDVFKGGA